MKVLKVMNHHLVAYVLPVLIVVLAVPLIAGIVPPNRWYGFRTPKTRSSREIWYSANRASGLYLLAAAVLAIMFNIILLQTQTDWPESRLASWMAASVVVSVLLALVFSLIHLRRL
jgi:hypothetical protein